MRVVRVFSSLVLALLLAKTGFGAIALDASTQASGSNSGSISWTHTNGATSNGAIGVQCSLSAGSSSTVTISSATYNSVALTHVTSSNAGTADLAYADSWFLKLGASPSTGAFTVQVNFSATQDGSFYCWAATFSGVDQTTGARTGAATAATPSTTNPSISPTCVANDVLMAALGAEFQGQGTVTNGGSQATQQEIDTVHLRGTTDTVCESQGFSGWTSGWTDSAVTGFAFIPASAGGGTGPKVGSLTTLGVGK